MARSFNGTSDFINLGNSNSLNFGATAPATFAAWFYATGGMSSGGTWILARDDNSLGRSFAFGYLNTGPLLQIAGNDVFSGPVGGQPTENVWTHLAIAGTSGGAWTCYVNGAVNNTGTDAGDEFAATTGNTTIGERTFSGFQGFFPGNLADVAMWNAVLTATEIAGLVKGARPFQIRSASLMGYWPLDGLQSPEPDLSGFAHNGTLTGTASAFGPPFMQFTPRSRILATPFPASAATAARYNLRMRMGVGI